MVLALAAGCGLGVAGCGQDDTDLPTLTGASAKAPTHLVEVAREYHDCLRDADIPANIYENDDGEMTVVELGGDPNVIGVVKDENDNWETLAPTDFTPADMEKIDEFMEEHIGEVGLLMNWADRTEDYAACLAFSGYDDNAAWGSQIDPTALTVQVASNNRWTACARENGWGSIEDTAMPTDLTDFDAWPTIILPATITEDQLRQLLAVCPNYNIDGVQARAEWRDSHGRGAKLPPELQYDAHPNIVIPMPARAGDEPTTAEQAAWDHWDALMTILSESGKYYFEQYREG